jgi:hypothetical protein
MRDDAATGAVTTAVALTETARGGKRSSADWAANSDARRPLS